MKWCVVWWIEAGRLADVEYLEVRRDMETRESWGWYIFTRDRASRQMCWVIESRTRRVRTGDNAVCINADAHSDTLQTGKLSFIFYILYWPHSAPAGHFHCLNLHIYDPEETRGGKLGTQMGWDENLKCLFQMFCPQPKDQRFTKTITDLIVY